jgi:hypothetical protein
MVRSEAWQALKIWGRIPAEDTPSIAALPDFPPYYARPFSSRNNLDRSPESRTHLPLTQSTIAMSSPNANGNTSPQSGDAAQGADEKPRLTEEEKKQNHIASGTKTPPRTSALSARSRVPASASG